MTIPAAADVAVVSAGGATGDDRHYVDWPAIIAGIVLASGISIVLLTFGSAIGLSFTNFRSGEGTSPIWVAIAAASWLLWVEVSSFMAGGYITGRLRRRFHDATEHESDVRDGAHGLLVWAGALVVGALIATSGIGALTNTVGSAASTVTQAASNVAGGAAQGATQAVADAVDPNAYFIDTLFRRASSTGTDAAAAAPAATTTAPAADTAAAPATDTAATTTAPAAASSATTTAPATTTSSSASGDLTEARGEVGRILAQSVTGTVSDEDKAYLGQLVAQNTGLSQQDADARVNTVLTNIDDAKKKAADAAETARKTGVLAAFLIAASFLVSAAGAYWAAMKGGRHRDDGTVFADVFRRY